jgi:hypothetical protein
MLIQPLSQWASTEITGGPAISLRFLWPTSLCCLFYKAFYMAIVSSANDFIIADIFHIICYHAFNLKMESAHILTIASPASVRPY